ncbi:MAG: carboxypeptidase-like regulatory domain-containing protein, partial [Flavitalea sp.]
MLRIFTFLLLTVSLDSFAQKHTLSGYVKDSLSGETLIGASVVFSGQTKGISSNNYGFYSITLPDGNYMVAISFAGYQSSAMEVNLHADTTVSFGLVQNSMMQEVIVSATHNDNNVKNAQMGKIDLSVNRIKSVPVLLGEVDVLKTLQLLPGVRNAGEGNTGLYVRGGGPDQNLIMLDDAIVYNSGHLFGFFSIFNSDAIKNISLIKGSMPAQYGGRLSSVLDVSMKEGNIKNFEGEGGIGLIASRISLQGP